MLLAWGPDLISLYNDAYSPILGERHLKALGKPLAQTWAGIWSVMKPLVDRALSGESLWSEDLPLVTFRHGYEEIAYFTFSLSPVEDETGAVAGLLCACTESTAKVQAEAALRRREAEASLTAVRLQSLFDQTPGFLAVLRGPDHVFEMANQAYQRLVGSRDLIGRPVRDALPEIVQQGFTDLLDRVYATGIAHIGEGARILLGTDPDRPPASRFLDFIYQPIREADGSVGGVLVQGHDVTEQKLAEEALARRDQILTTALSSGRSVAFEVNVQTGTLTYSDSSRSALHFRSVPLEDYMACVHEEDREAVALTLQRALATGQSEQVEARFAVPDGKPIWLGIRLQAMPGGDGEGPSLAGISTDITERKDTEAQIAFQASLLDAVGQSVMATDLDGRIIYYNTFAERLYGWSADEATGRHVAELTSGNDPAKSAAAMAFLASGGSWSGEFPAKHKDGSTFPAYVTDSPIYDGSGRQIGVMGVSHDLRQQKQVEAELREKSAFLEATLENMDQGIMVMGPEGRVTLFNQRALDLLELPRDFIAAHPLVSEIKQVQRQRGEFDHPGCAGLGLQESESFLTDPPLYERVRPDGTVIEFRTVLLPHGGAVRTYTDITARRQAEEDLRESEERYRALVHATASILWRAGPDGSIFHIGGFDGYSGPLEDLHGFGWLNLVHPDDREQLVREWRAIVASGKPGESVYRFMGPGGEYRWVCCRAAPLTRPDGTIREWVGTLGDIHEQQHAEEALRQSREELRAALDANRNIFDHSLDVICTIDEHGAFVHVSPRAADVWGYAPEELIGRHYIDLVHPEDVEKSKAVTEQIMAGVPTFAFENRFIRKDGSVVPLLWSAAWEAEHGTMFSIARDLTERLQAEERLRQAQKMEVVGQLTGGVAHDFRNLLTVILGNAEILAEAPPDPGQAQELSKIILQTAERGAELTQHLLAFGRRQTLRPVRLHLDEVVHGMMPLFRRTIGEDIEVRTEFARSKLAALVDRNLLENAILNLAVNARDAMPTGGLLTIQTSQRGAGPGEGSLPVGQDVVVVTVSDTGTGMSPEVLGRVFEPFFTTKEVGKGSGLGLSMVYGFAQQSGGHVSIESRPGQGTAVPIVLPAVVSKDREADRVDHARAAPRGRERVLAVEDEPHVLQFVASQLLGLGYEVTAVADGPDALAVLSQDSSFDLLLSDIVLPKGMSGVELTKAARGLKPDLKVLYTSGYPEDVFRNHEIDHDIRLLRKPYRRKELAAALREVLDGTRTQP
ncbi:MAG TPA: PAS domain S-box protein [Microvirga sp.]|jgi:PAS domain S-box-containing protein|nr:PAS domain S-box protein [Microvirga sp.]